MEIKKLTVNGKEYEFVNETVGTRNGFAHNTTLFVNGCRKGNARCNYLNRTWECYRYQTVMMNCVYGLKDREFERIKKEFMESKCYLKLTPNRKEELLIIIENDDYMKELNEVIKGLK